MFQSLEYKHPKFYQVFRLFIVFFASLLYAWNLRYSITDTVTFAKTAGLFPGGFSGLSLLLQQIGLDFIHVSIPFSVFNIGLNLVPTYIAYKFIGKKFTGYSCLMIVVSGILTDIVPSFPMTEDILLISIFGGLINALAISLCLFANATSGGTDFIAIFLSEKYGIDSWNYIFAGNVVILGIAGALFGWDKALYSIIFQYTSTQVLHILYKRYQKQTLIIVTKRPEDVYEAIAEITHHDATLIKGEGCYSKQECDVLYSVVGRDEVNKVVNTVRKTDPQAFVNMIRTENLAGRFYQRPND